MMTECRVGSEREVQLERWVIQKTGGRVHRLRIEIHQGGELLVTGYAGSYHVRQLALSAILDVLAHYDTQDDQNREESGARSVEMRIQVTGEP